MERATTTTTPQQQQQQLSSTTAPGKMFASRKELADHYKSDWHKYNLKRREAGLPLLLESDFQARLAAALSLRQEEGRNGTSHLKKGKKQKPKKQHQPQKNKNTPAGSNDDPNSAPGVVTAKSQAAAYDSMKDGKAGGGDNGDALVDNAMETDEQGEEVGEPAMEEEEVVTIDPKQCLFDRHFSATVEANADRMYRKYGFFLPDREYLTDLEGLVGYAHEKIKLGHMCLYCHKVFPSWQGCQKHMISKSHTKLKYEDGIDLEELSVFYDFSEADNEFMKSIGAPPREKTHVVSEADDDDNDDVMEDDGATDWEDISDDEEMADAEDGEDDDGDDIYDQYEHHLAQYGFDVNDLGELILPNGRVIGHRALSRYYKQRVPTSNKNSTAIVAARRAAGERLFDGQVFNINGLDDNTLALTRAGIHPNLAAGRAGKGILVKGQSGVYSSVSIYRYRAAVRKARVEEKQGERLYDRSKQNMNRMDKKANRLMNNVSVAHAKR